MKDHKNIVLTVLMIAVLIMGYGYSVLLQELSIHGSAEINGATWQIEITGIKDKGLLGSAEVVEEPTFTKTTASLNSAFKYKGDSVIYQMMVENKGSMDAKLDSIQILPSGDAKSAVTYKVTNVTPGATMLRAGETNEIDVTVAYSNPENQTELDFTETVAVVLNYVQAQV